MAMKLVVHSAKLRCSEGLSPSTLTVPPLCGSTADEKPVATVMDFQPTVHIAPFGLCKSPANPQVATATAAAMGALTPQPCVPAIPAPWSPGAAVATVRGVKALTDRSTCSCMWAGTVEITDAGSDVDVE